MIELYSIPNRVYNNRTLSGRRRVSDLVDPATTRNVLLRFEIVSITGTIALEINMYLDGVFTGGSTRVFDAAGRYELGLWHSQADINSEVEIIATVTGSARINAVLYAVGRGEDVIEWQ